MVRSLAYRTFQLRYSLPGYLNSYFAPDFNVDVGTLTMQGPREVNLECTLLIRCAVLQQGWGLIPC